MVTPRPLRAQAGRVTTPLTREVGRLLRSRRETAGWTQDRLARRAGTSQQCLSRIERGSAAARLDTVERLFATLGWQLRVDLRQCADEETPDQPGEIDDEARASVMGRFEWYLGKARGTPYVIEGELGALLQGVPLETDTLSIAVAEEEMDRLADWILTTPPCLRWNTAWDDWGGNHPDPRRPGAMRWKLGIGELKVNVVPQLPRPVPVRVGNTEYPVRPLDQIVGSDPEVARILERRHARSTT
jgi:transcriptional regulator with XRE-family HTH domain